MRFPLKKGSCGVCDTFIGYLNTFHWYRECVGLGVDICLQIFADSIGIDGMECSSGFCAALESINQMQMMSSRTIKFSSASREENAEFHKPAAPTRNCSLMIENRERLITPREVIESQIKNADIKADRVRCDSAMEPRPFCVWATTPLLWVQPRPWRGDAEVQAGCLFAFQHNNRSTTNSEDNALLTNLFNAELSALGRKVIDLTRHLLALVGKLFDWRPFRNN